MLSRLLPVSILAVSIFSQSACQVDKLKKALREGDYPDKVYCDFAAKNWSDAPPNVGDWIDEGPAISEQLDIAANAEMNHLVGLSNFVLKVSQVNEKEGLQYVVTITRPHSETTPELYWQQSTYHALTPAFKSDSVFRLPSHQSTVSCHSIVE